MEVLKTLVDGCRVAADVRPMVVVVGRAVVLTVVGRALLNELETAVDVGRRARVVVSSRMAAVRRGLLRVVEVGVVEGVTRPMGEVLGMMPGTADVGSE